jgi:C1A family cysteine protease
MIKKNKQKYKENIMSADIVKNSWDSKNGSNGVSQYKDPKYIKSSLLFLPERQAYPK